jgi:hypothetical protein
MVPLLQVNGRQMLPKFDVPKCHCASFLKYGVHVQYVQFIPHQIWHSGKMFSWIEFRRVIVVIVLYKFRFSDSHSKIMCLWTKTAPHHLALSAKSTTGYNCNYSLLNKLLDLHNRQEESAPLVLWLLMRKKTSSKICELQLDMWESKWYCGNWLIGAIIE